MPACLLIGMNVTSPELAARLTKASRFIAWSAIFIGGSTLLGWITGNVALQTWVVSPITMKAITAAAFVLAGVALLLLLPDGDKGSAREWIGQGLAVVVAVLGWLSVLQYLLDISLGIDNFLIQEPLGPLSGQYPGRMGAITAVGFLCLGGALFGLRPGGWRWAPRSLLAVLAGLLGVMGIHNILVDPLVAHVGTASHTALAFLLMGFGVLFARPQEGFMRLVTSPGTSGALARQLLPMAIVVPWLLTVLSKLGERYGSFNPVVWTSLMVVLRIVAICAIIYWALRSAQSMEAAREVAEHGVRRANRALQTLSQANEAVVRAGTEQELLEAVCRIVVETGGYKLAWVGVPEDDQAKTVRPAACAGAMAGVPRGPSPAGTAIRTGQIQVAKNLHTNPVIEPWRETAIENGFGSLIAFPLRNEGHILAALSIYAAEPDAFDDQEVDLLGKLAANLAFGISALRVRQGRALAEAGLQRSEQRHRSLVLATTQMVWATGPDGQVRHPNPAWQKFTGQTDAEVMGEGWTNALHPEDVERTKKSWADAVKTCTLYTTEYRVRRDDGEYRHFLARGVPVLTEDQSIREWIRSCTDITEQKRAQQETDRYFTLPLQMLCMCGFDGYFKRLNPAWQETLGYSVEELMAKPYLEFVHPDDRPATNVAAVEYTGATHTLTFENRYRHKDGSYRWLFWKYFPIPEEAVFYAVAYDVTEQKELDRGLREAQAYNRGLLESSIDGLVTVDQALSITDVNEAMCGMAGKPRDQIIGSFFPNYFTEPSRAEESVRQTFAQGSVADYQLLLRAAAGREIPVSFNASVFRDPAGQVRGIFAAARDITERRRAEENLERYAEQLKRSNQELEDFATVASHDLQEPLRKIGAFGDRLGQRCSAALDEQGRDYLARMINAARRMSELINSLLGYSRITRKGGKFEPTNLNAVASEVLADLESRIEDTAAEVTVGPLPTLLADPVQMRQLLQNLISNALKFRKDAGGHHVEVASRPEENGFWEIHVTDNGIGFEERFLDRIFKPFQRLHGRGEFEGHGMGLAVCDKIVRRHGGRLTACSQPGQGSDFIVMLPRLPSEERPWTNYGKMESART